jgi:membrane protein YqaA with SNARE-associated domain
MSIEIEPGTTAQEPAGSGPVGPRLARPWWMRPAIHTGIIGAIIGYFIGHWLGNFLSWEYARNALSDMNDFPLVLGYVLAIIGWLAGLGIFNDLGRQILGKKRKPSAG